MPPEADTPGTNSPPPAAPGVFLLGIFLAPITAFINPWLLAKVWPPLFHAQPTWWWPVCTVHFLMLILVLRCVIRWKKLGETKFAALVFQRLPVLGGILHTVVLTLSLLACTEAVFWRVNVYKGAHSSGNGSGNRYVPTFYRDDPLLGLRPASVSSVEHLCYEKPDRKPIFKKTYTLEDDGLRFVPQPDAPKTQHAAFFGCSLTFGIGCNDDETYPAQYAQRNPDTHVYNFAFASYAPSQACLLLMDGITRHIEEEEGAAFFLFFPDHVARLLPKIRYATSWTRHFPAFRLSPSGEAQFCGTLDTAFPWRIGMMDILANEHLVKWSGIDFPNNVRPQDLELCAAILAKARENYRKHFPANEFYVILDPVCFAAFDFRSFIAALNVRGVPFLSAKGVYGDAPWSQHYPRDKHPLPEANVRLADWLARHFPDGVSAGPLTPASETPEG